MTERNPDHGAGASVRQLLERVQFPQTSPSPHPSSFPSSFAVLRVLLKPSLLSYIFRSVNSAVNMSGEHFRFTGPASHLIIDSDLSGFPKQEAQAMIDILQSSPIRVVCIKSVSTPFRSPLLADIDALTTTNTGLCARVGRKEITADTGPEI
jgi:hypothetical protein